MTDHMLECVAASAHLDEVGRILVLDVEHLLVDLLGRHAAAEEGARREVAAVARVGGGPANVGGGGRGAVSGEECG